MATGCGTYLRRRAISGGRSLVGRLISSVTILNVTWDLRWVTRCNRSSTAGPPCARVWSYYIKNKSWKYKLWPLMQVSDWYDDDDDDDDTAQERSTGAQNAFHNRKEIKVFIQTAKEVNWVNKNKITEASWIISLWMPFWFVSAVIWTLPHCQRIYYLPL
jgi:hypothetical protein